MELRHIEIAKLSVSPANMRRGGKAPDLTNILPSVRARGVLVPLIVRARPCPAPDDGDAPESFVIVAGKRRYHAARAVAEEGGEIDALPCAVIDAGDDAAALEASLIENVARLDPDEVTRWETFTRLVREGRKPEHIAILFGLTDVQVKRTLALGNLLPGIRNLYRKGDVDAVTVQHLTLASMARQREWLAFLDDPKPARRSARRADGGIDEGQQPAQLLHRDRRATFHLDLTQGRNAACGHTNLHAVAFGTPIEKRFGSRFSPPFGRTRRGKPPWGEFDLDKAVWSIPAARMKMKEAHVIPLAPTAVELLRLLRKRHLELHGKVTPETLLFSFGKDKPISDMTMLKVLRDMKVEYATVHGFRSTFTDWVAECTNVPKEVADKALAHRIANAVEAAYRRTDFLDRRRVLMNEWANFLLG